MNNKNKNYDLNISILYNLDKDNVFLAKLDELVSKTKFSVELKNFKRLIIEKDLNFKDNETERIESLRAYWNDKKKSDLEYIIGKQELIDADEKGTQQLLLDLKAQNLIHDDDYLMELAAGVGRITKNILVKWFSKIDTLEPSKVLADKIVALKKNYKQIKKIYVTTGEDFKFERKYNVIFATWLFGNINDYHALKLLIKCRENLDDNGIFVLKENISEDHTLVTTSGMTQKIRTLQCYKVLFSLAGFKEILNRNTKGWPSHCYMLREFILVKNNKIIK